MAWSSADGSHEGSVGMLFRDGALGSGWCGATVLVTTDGRGCDLDCDQWEYRNEQDVIGWIPACNCGWRGRPWARAKEPWDFDADMRLVYGPDSILPEAIQDGALYDEWHHHAVPADPLTQLGALAAAHAEAGQQLTNTVALARQRGATWTQIGAAVGICRQSAHERWAHRDPTRSADPKS